MRRQNRVLTILWLLAVSPALIISMLMLFVWLQVNYRIIRPLGYRLKDWEGSEIPQAAVEMAHGLFPGHRWGPDPSEVKDGFNKLEWCPGCHAWRNAQ